MKSLNLDQLSSVTGGAPCLPQAKQAAIDLSASENHADPAMINVTGTKSLGRNKNGDYNYAVSLDNRERVNVRLSPSCHVRDANVVSFPGMAK